MVAPGGVIGVRELGAGDGESLDERGIAFDDEQHQGRARAQSDRRAERPRACEEISGENETAPADDAPECQRCDVERAKRFLKLYTLLMDIRLDGTTSNVG